MIEEECISTLAGGCYFVEKHLWSGDSRREIGSYPYILNSASTAPSVSDSCWDLVWVTLPSTGWNQNNNSIPLIECNVLQYSNSKIVFTWEDWHSEGRNVRTVTLISLHLTKPLTSPNPLALNQDRSPLCHLFHLCVILLSAEFLSSLPFSSHGVCKMEWSKWVWE